MKVLHGSRHLDVAIVAQRASQILARKTQYHRGYTDDINRANIIDVIDKKTSKRDVNRKIMKYS